MSEKKPGDEDPLEFLDVGDVALSAFLQTLELNRDLDVNQKIPVAYLFSLIFRLELSDSN